MSSAPVLTATAAARLWPRPARSLTPRALARAGLALDAVRGEALLGHLDAARRIELAVHGAALAAWIADRLRRRRRVSGARGMVVGVNGGQGSGKSTLSALAAEALGTDFGVSSLVLSIDDLYLTRAERSTLAERVHPLLATRGVPGTHDVELGLDVIRRATGASGPWSVAEGDAALRVPRFDKAIDDRRPEADWGELRRPVDVVLFEGWCVGATAGGSDELAAPCNALETTEDADGRWRGYVEACLRGAYADLFDCLDALVMLRVPDFGAVLHWRRAQEAQLRARTGGGMSEAGIERFVAHYERVTRRQLRELPARADLCLQLGEDHAITAVHAAGA